MTGKTVRQESGTVIETRTYNSLNQIVTNEIDDGTSTATWVFQHDDNGNMTRKALDDDSDVWEYEWNRDNQLVQVTHTVDSQVVAAVSYDYDRLGRMLVRTEGSNIIRLRWNGLHTTLQEDPSGNTLYVTAGDRVQAFERATLVYDAWGMALPGSASSVSTTMEHLYIGYFGVKSDAATGLYYMVHRWYDPSLQRSEIPKPRFDRLDDTWKQIYVRRQCATQLHRPIWAGGSLCCYRPGTFGDERGHPLIWAGGPLRSGVHRRESIKSHSKRLLKCPYDHHWSGGYDYGKRLGQSE
jgi:hypothetical protein